MREPGGARRRGESAGWELAEACDWRQSGSVSRILAPPGRPFGGRRCTSFVSEKPGDERRMLPRAKPGGPMKVPFGAMRVSCSIQEWVRVGVGARASRARRKREEVMDDMLVIMGSNLSSGGLMEVEC
jgi:hypothetical protein